MFELSSFAEGFNFLSSVETRLRNSFMTFIEMTDCILEAVNSSTHAYIGALTGRMCPPTSHD
jgi:hypothetical protein